MPAKDPDLHGSAPDKCEIALLLIDVINDNSGRARNGATPPAPQAAGEKAGVPAIYVNGSHSGGGLRINSMDKLGDVISRQTTRDGAQSLLDNQKSA